MDTLTSSVSALRIPSAFPATSRDLFHLRSTSLSTHLSHISSFVKSNPIPKSANSIASHKLLKPLSSSSIPVRSSSPTLHRRPATGYAAALIDVAQSKGSLQSVEYDVERFLKLLGTKRIAGILNDPFMGEKEKGRVVREVAEKGGFHRQLVRLTKMLIEKNKLGILKEVLSEFERIYDELCGTQVVLVSSSRKMGEDKLSGIAMEVQKLSGAVKVKVRSFIHGESL